MRGMVPETLVHVLTRVHHRIDTLDRRPWPRLHQPVLGVAVVATADDLPETPPVGAAFHIVDEDVVVVWTEQGPDPLDPDGNPWTLASYLARPPSSP